MIAGIQKTAENSLIFLFILLLAVTGLKTTAALAQSPNYATAQPLQSGANGGSPGGPGTSGSFSGTTYAPPQRFFPKNEAAVTPESPYKSLAAPSAVFASPDKASDQSGKKGAGALARAAKPELKNSGMLNNYAGGQFSNGYSAGPGFQSGYSAGTQFRNSSSSLRQQISQPLEYVRMPDGTYRASGSRTVRDERVRVQ